MRESIIIDCAQYVSSLRAVHDAIDAGKRGPAVLERPTDHAIQELEEECESISYAGSTIVYGGRDIDGITWQVQVRA